MCVLKWQICDSEVPQHWTVSVSASYPGAKYDAEKAAKEEKELKEKQLKKIEEARKKASEKSKGFPKQVWYMYLMLTVLCYHSLFVTAAKEETDPGFVEKLVTQIIKNVQVCNLSVWVSVTVLQTTYWCVVLL